MGTIAYHEKSVSNYRYPLPIRPEARNDGREESQLDATITVY